MIPITREEMVKLLALAEPLVQLLRTRFDPHHEVRITSEAVEIKSGICRVIAPDDLTPQTVANTTIDLVVGAKRG